MKRFAKALLLAAMLSIITPVHSQATELSAEDRALLAALVYHEAGNQDEYGKRLVAAVVLNRVDDPRFPETVQDVIYQRGQFTTASELARFTPTQECYTAVDAESAERSNTEIFFFNNGPVYGTFLFRYQDHNFGGLN